ncbi:MAG TPA: hypothetical protein VK206_25320 [Anaerolineales bacterium]|nr:hypothetical protein [Anaerolineales bacterium]
MTSLLFAVSIGLGQWLVLRRRLLRAGWWTVANVLGWEMLALITLGHSMGQDGLALMGLLPAHATMVMLALLLNQAPPADPSLYETVMFCG